MADLAAALDLTVTSQLTSVNWGPELEFEGIFNLTERIGVGLGIGYIRRTDESVGQVELLPLARASRWVEEGWWVEAGVQSVEEGEAGLGWRRWIISSTFFWVIVPNTFHLWR